MNNSFLPGIFLIIVLLFVPRTQVAAQQGNPMFYKEVILQHKAYTLHDLTSELHRQSGITFSYDAVKINPDRKIKLKTDRITVRELLALIRKRTGIGYKVVSNTHIIYTFSGGKRPVAIRKKKTRKEKSPAREKVFTAPEEEAPGNEEPSIGVSPTGAGTTPQIVVIGDSATAASYYFSGGGGGGGSYAGGNYTQKYPVVLHYDEDDDEDTDDNESELGATHSARSGSGSFSNSTADFIKDHGLIAAGLSADEIYYLAPTLKAGFDFLYGTVSYNIGNFSHWRYGIGGSARINERWRMHLELNTGGTFKQDYNIITYDTLPPQDSSGQPGLQEKNTPLVVQSRLTRVTLSTTWNISGGFFLGAGIIFNHLKTTYYSNGNKVALSNILPIGYDADKKYKTLDPPYQLGNSYTGNNPSNVKTWIGLQVSLIYRINFFD